MSLSIKQTTREKPPRVSFALIKDEILGEPFELSLVFCGSALARSLNRQYRLKDKVGNVLSFPLSKQSGEIFSGWNNGIDEANHKRWFWGFAVLDTMLIVFFDFPSIA